MILHAGIKHYHGIKALEIDLTPCTLLVGENGSGKTALLEALSQLHFLPQTLGTAYQVKGDNLSLSEFTFDLGRQHIQMSRKLECLEVRELGQPLAKGASLEQIIPRVTFLHSNHNFRELEVELTQVLTELVENPILFGRLEITMSELFPLLTRLKFDGQDLFFVFDEDLTLPASSVGMGILLALRTLSSAFLHWDLPHLLLIDGLERELDAEKGHLLLSVLQDIQSFQPHLQIVASSNSIEQISAVMPEQVQCLAYSIATGSRAACLTLSDSLEAWGDSQDTGMVWHLAGTQWILEQDWLEPVE